MVIFVFSLSSKIFAASSDYERYGSMAWSNARSNERTVDYNSRYSANANSNTHFSSAEMASIMRAFNPPRPPEYHPSQPVYHERGVNAGETPAATEEQQHLTAAKAGNGQAMTWLGEYYFGNLANKSVALSWYEAAARTGDAQGMAHAYYLLLDNRYGLRNDQRALEWLKKLADQEDNPEWAGAYGWRLWDGDGVPQDKMRSFQYRLKAASHGSTDDRLRVADAYASGEGVEKNPLEAIAWYRRIADWDIVAAPLARLLVEDGGGAEKNRAEITRLFTPASLGYPANRFYHAYLKETGELPPRDLKLARDTYAEVLDIKRAYNQFETQINPARQGAAKRLMELCVRGEGGPVDHATARAAGLFALKAGDESFRPLVLGYLLVDPALGEPEKDWAVKIFDAHPDDMEALRECAHLTREPIRMKTLADRGDAEAARFMANFERYYVTLGTEEAQQRARGTSREWAAKGAALANLDCLSLQGAWLLEDARLINQPDVAATMVTEGLACLKKAAASQSPLGMARLGESYRDGEGVEKNLVEAFGWFKKSADLGLNRGQYDLAMALHTGAGATADKATALKLMGEAAPDIPDAAGVYGLWLWRGDCGPPDVAEGAKWMDAALQRGYWLAGRNLAKYYHLGSGVPKDERRALDYLVKAAEVGDESARRIVAEAFEKGEIIDKDDSEADERFEKLGRANAAGNGGLVAAHFLRQGAKKKAMWWVLYGGNEVDPEIIRVRAELKKDLDAMVATELPGALATLDKTLAQLESAAAGFTATGERTSFFKYEVHYGTTRRLRDDDYERIAIMPATPERNKVLGARDASLAGEGDFEAAIISQQDYYAGDPVRGPRFLAAVRKIAVDDADRGDLAAINELVRISWPMFDEEMISGWNRDDRESIRWCRRALLAGNREAVSYVNLIYDESVEQTQAIKATPTRRQQWKTLSAELEKISDDDPNHVALIAAATLKFLPPE